MSADDGLTQSSREILRAPFARDDGHCWRCQVAIHGDDTTDPAGSALILFEDGQALEPPHCSHSEIRVLGRGRYSHWNTAVYFSTSDNSDPNSNGREYHFEISRDRYFDRRARMAAETVRWYDSHLGGDGAFSGRQVLEIGPGRDMGTALLMACLGAKVDCIEKYHRGWLPDWHGPFVERLIGVATSLAWLLDLEPLRRSLREGAFDPGRITIIDSALEELPPSCTALAEIFVSHSVFEHFEDPRRAIPQLRRACRRGARGVHRIDFRDHREPQKPLEFLLLVDDEFEKLDTYRFGYGNRMRLAEYRQVLEASFEEVGFVEEVTIDEGYLRQFLPRLKECGSRFADMPGDALRTLGGTFILRCRD